VIICRGIFHAASAAGGSLGATLQTVEFLDDLFDTSWIHSRQLALFIQCFTGGQTKRTDFGTYNVELIISLFGRVKDLHNFELVLSQITAEDHANLLGRLGHLLLFNPFKPDGSIRLFMSSWEQRQVCIISNR
jgi:hypothetical protein